MKVSELLADRRQRWQELERLCGQFETTRRRYLPADVRARFAALYRSACADLALADAYQLPLGTIRYLHLLVGRAHNQLYRSRSFDMQGWGRMLLVDAPQSIFNDRCVHVAFCLFWGIFLLSAFLAANATIYPGYAESVLGEEALEQLEDNFSDPITGRDPSVNFAMAGFYIYNNTGIGLRCFAGGLLIIPGLFVTVFNAAHLGAAFGYMARPDMPEGENFFHFVTAHGPFELTAIVLSAGAGLRLGMGWLSTHGLSRVASVRKTANEAMPLVGAVMILFFLAALIEGFLSPTGAPYLLKALVAIGSSGLLLFYFVILGYPQGR